MTVFALVICLFAVFVFALCSFGLIFYTIVFDFDLCCVCWFVYLWSVCNGGVCLICLLGGFGCLCFLSWFAIFWYFVEFTGFLCSIVCFVLHHALRCAVQVCVLFCFVGFGVLRLRWVCMIWLLVGVADLLLIVLVLCFFRSLFCFYLFMFYLCFDCFDYVVGGLPFNDLCVIVMICLRVYLFVVIVALLCFCVFV